MTDSLAPEWQLSTLGRSARMLSGAGFPIEEQGVVDEEVAFYKVNALARADARGILGPADDTISQDTAARLRAPVLPVGSIVMAKIGAALLLGRIRMTRSVATIDNNMIAVVPRAGTDPTFLAYALQTIDMEPLANPGAVPSLDMRAFRHVSILRPSVESQRAIADYLDRETARIDAFIAENEKLITLLAERRAAIVARFVLRGLDVGVSLRQTDVPWLGLVPEHWEVSRLSRWFAVTLGKMLDQSKFADTDGELLPYVRAANIKPGQLDLSDAKEMPFTREEQSRFDLRAGDLLVVEGGSIGVNAALDDDMPGWGFQKTVNRIRSRGPGVSRYLGYQLDIIREAGALDMITNVSTIQHLTAEKLERIVVAMPPANEQHQIVERLEQRTNFIDAAIATASEAIDLARERRAALISAAVTGKIDVGVVA